MNYISPDKLYKIVETDAAANEEGVVKTLLVYKKRPAPYHDYALALMVPLKKDVTSSAQNPQDRTKEF